MYIVFAYYAKPKIKHQNIKEMNTREECGSRTHLLAFAERDITALTTPLIKNL